jgi:hypothetical protein
MPPKVAAPGDLVDVHLAGDVAGPRQIAGVVRADRRHLGGQARGVVEGPDLPFRGQRQPGRIDGQAHGPVKRPQQHRQSTVNDMKDDQLAGLIGGDQQRGLALAQQLHDLVGMDIAEGFLASRRRRWYGGGIVHGAIIRRPAGP